jgi:hypothetical protein
VRSQLVIPAVGAACGGAALALGVSPALALVGAALAAALRALAGDSPAQIAASALAGLAGLAGLAELGGELTRAAIALAAAAWTVSELARSPEPAVDAADAAAQSRPVIAVLAAVVAAVLDPSFAALIAIAGVRLVTAPARRPRPRWSAVVPIAGAAVVPIAVFAGTARSGLAAHWFAAQPHPVAGAALAGLVVAALGPVTAVAALVGLAALVRARWAELALAASIAGALLVDLRAGAVGAATIGLAALLAGLAIGRLAAMIRMPSGQAFVAAIVGVLVILPPAWTAIDHRAAAAHSGRASR